MKIKVIDLLNKIANGEEVPKKIRFDNTYWNRICGEKNMYYKNDYDDSLFVYFFRRDLTFTLNDEVEIIEEPKKIKYPILHKTAPSETGDQMPNWRKLIDVNFEHLNKTIYQLIDEINNLKEK